MPIGLRPIATLLKKLEQEAKKVRGGCPCGEVGTLIADPTECKLFDVVLKWSILNEYLQQQLGTVLTGSPYFAFRAEWQVVITEESPLLGLLEEIGINVLSDIPGGSLLN